MRPFQIWQRITALFLSVTLCLLNTVEGLPYAYAHPERVSAHGQSQDGASLIPETLGQVEEKYAGTNGKTVFFIQDAHDFLEAQENIAAIIQHLVAAGDVRTVFEEGFQGAVPTDDYFREVPEPEVRRRVAYFLLDTLRIGGAEYAHITRERDFRLVGADRIDLHRKNIAFYQAASGFREEVGRDLAAIKTELEGLAARFFPSVLKEWMRLRSRADLHQIDLWEYLARFQKIRKTVNPRGRTELNMDYPQIHLLTETMRLSGTLAEKKVKALEASALFREISNMEDLWLQELNLEPKALDIYRHLMTVRLLERLNRIELTSADYEAARGILPGLKTQGLADFIARETGRPVVLSRKWETSIQSAMDFYEAARLRDEAVREALGDFLKSPGEMQAVLVFGGFHKDRIREFLRDGGFSYQTIIPAITRPDPVHRAYYARLMSEGRHPFEWMPYAAQAARAASAFLRAFDVGDVAVRAELRVIADAVRASGSGEIPILHREIERSLTRAREAMFSEEPRAEMRANIYGLERHLSGALVDYDFIVTESLGKVVEKKNGLETELPYLHGYSQIPGVTDPRVGRLTYVRIGRWHLIDHRMKDLVEPLLTGPWAQYRKNILYLFEMESSIADIERNLADFAAPVIAAVDGLSLRGKRTLDLGSGSGILSLVAYRKGARPVLLDYDIKYRNLLLKHLEVNGIPAEAFHFIHADINKPGQILQELGDLSFDAVFGNIGEHPIYPKGTHVNAISLLDHFPKVRHYILGGYALGYGRRMTDGSVEYPQDRAFDLAAERLRDLGFSRENARYVHRFDIFDAAETGFKTAIVFERVPAKRRRSAPGERPELRGQKKVLRETQTRLLDYFPEAFGGRTVTKVYLISDNTGTLTQDYQTPVEKPVLPALTEFVSAPDRGVIVSTGDPISLLLRASHPSVFNGLSEDARTRYVFSSDAGNRVTVFDAEAGKWMTLDLKEPWAPSVRYEFSKLMIDRFFSELIKAKGSQDAFAKFLEDVSVERLEEARQDAFRKMEEIGPESWGYVEDPIGRFEFYFLPPDLNELLGEALVYGIGSKMTIDMVAKRKDFPLAFTAAIADAAREKFKPQENGFTVTSGPGYVDLSKMEKAEGALSVFEKKFLPGINPSDAVVIFVLGDSANDLETFDLKFPDHPNVAVVPVFVSHDSVYAERLSSGTMISQGENMEGAAEFIRFASSVQGKTIRHITLPASLKWVSLEVKTSSSPRRSELRTDVTDPSLYVEPADGKTAEQILYEEWIMESELHGLVTKISLKENSKNSLKGTFKISNGKELNFSVATVSKEMGGGLGSSGCVKLKFNYAQRDVFWSVFTWLKEREFSEVRVGLSDKRDKNYWLSGGMTGALDFWRTQKRLAGAWRVSGDELIFDLRVWEELVREVYIPSKISNHETNLRARFNPSLRKLAFVFFWGWVAGWFAGAFYAAVKVWGYPGLKVFYAKKFPKDSWMRRVSDQLRFEHSRLPGVRKIGLLLQKFWTPWVLASSMLAAGLSLIFSFSPHPPFWVWFPLAVILGDILGVCLETDFIIPWFQPKQRRSGFFDLRVRTVSYLFTLTEKLILFGVWVPLADALSVFIHEGGHYSMTKWTQMRAAWRGERIYRKIIFHPFIALVYRMPASELKGVSPDDNFWFALAGPAASFLLGAGLFAKLFFAGVLSPLELLIAKISLGSVFLTFLPADSSRLLGRDFDNMKHALEFKALFFSLKDNFGQEGFHDIGANEVGFMGWWPAFQFRAGERVFFVKRTFVRKPSKRIFHRYNLTAVRLNDFRWIPVYGELVLTADDQPTFEHHGKSYALYEFTDFPEELLDPDRAQSYRPPQMTDPDRSELRSETAQARIWDALNREPLFVQARRDFETSGAARIDNRKYWAEYAKTFGEEKEFDTSLHTDIAEFVADLPEGASVLEIGAGVGDAALEMLVLRRDLKYTGMDISAKSITEAQSKLPQARWIAEDFSKYRPSEDERYDGIFVSDTLHLLSPDQQALALLKVKSLLNKKGLVFIRWAPGENVPLIKQGSHWVFLASPDYIEMMLKHAGLGLKEPVRQETEEIYSGTPKAKLQDYLKIYAGHTGAAKSPQQSGKLKGREMPADRAGFTEKQEKRLLALQKVFGVEEEDLRELARKFPKALGYHPQNLKRKWDLLERMGVARPARLRALRTVITYPTPVLEEIVEEAALRRVEITVNHLRTIYDRFNRYVWRKYRQRLSVLIVPETAEEGRVKERMKPGLKTDLGTVMTAWIREKRPGSRSELRARQADEFSYEAKIQGLVEARQMMLDSVSRIEKSFRTHNRRTKAHGTLGNIDRMDKKIGIFIRDMARDLEFGIVSDQKLLELRSLLESLENRQATAREAGKAVTALREALSSTEEQKANYEKRLNLLHPAEWKFWKRETFSSPAVKASYARAHMAEISTRLSKILENQPGEVTNLTLRLREFVLAVRIWEERQKRNPESFAGWSVPLSGEDLRRIGYSRNKPPKSITLKQIAVALHGVAAHATISEKSRTVLFSLSEHLMHLVKGASQYTFNFMDSRPEDSGEENDWENEFRSELRRPIPEGENSEIRAMAASFLSKTAKVSTQGVVLMEAASLGILSEEQKEEFFKTAYRHRSELRFVLYGDFSFLGRDRIVQEAVKLPNVIFDGAGIDSIRRRYRKPGSVMVHLARPGDIDRLREAWGEPGHGRIRFFRIGKESGTIVLASFYAMNRGGFPGIDDRGDVATVAAGLLDSIREEYLAQLVVGLSA